MMLFEISVRRLTLAPSQRDLPRCQTEQQTVYFLPGRTFKLRCRLQARPDQVRFKWDINSTSTDYRRSYLTRFRSSGASSTIQHRLDGDESAEVRCWGSNGVGLQRTPCVFRLEPAGVPEPLSGCTISNNSITSFEVRCRPGLDGGLPQTFVLEVRDSNTQQVVHSYSQKEAVFHVRGLSPGVNFTLMVYASSARGQGEMSLLQAGTVALIPHRIAYSRPASAGPVAAAAGGLAGLLLLAVGGLVCLRRRLPNTAPQPPELTDSPDLLPTVPLQAGE